MKIIIRTLFFLLALITGFSVGRSYESQKHNEPETQTSEYIIHGSAYDLVKDMCCEAGIDFEKGEFIFTCPKCDKGGARWQQNKEWSLYSNWLTKYPILEELKPGETASPQEDYGQQYCHKCGYPMGTDWLLIEIE